MNAKEISDSTLESVTPADNDLMLIYDTSEGTTGKVPLNILKAFFYQPVPVEYTIKNGTVLEGGVFRVGNLVIINISISFTTISDYTRVLENLPSPKFIVVNFSFTIAKTGSEICSACGYIQNNHLDTRLLGGISSGTAYISVTYICN